MYELPFEVSDAGNIGIFPRIQNSRPVHKNITSVLRSSPNRGHEGEFPNAFILLPHRGLNFRVKFHIFFQIVRRRNVLEVSPDLLGARIEP